MRPAKPYLERLDLYVDGPATLKVKSNGAELEGALIAGVVADEAATVVSDLRHPDPADADNQVWRISASGGAAEVYLVAPDLSQSDVLRTGFDFSGNRLTGPGGEPVGEIAFDLRVQAMAPEAALSIGLDSGFPDATPFELPKDQIVGDEWRTYSVKFADLLDGSGTDCCGLDLKNLVRLSSSEPPGAMSMFYLTTFASPTPAGWWVPVVPEPPRYPRRSAPARSATVS